MTNLPIPSGPAPTAKAALRGSRVVDRFGEAGEAGWSPVPDVLIFHQHQLKLRSEDLNVLLNLIAHWYLPGAMPFIRPTTIAKRMGVSPRSVQRSIARLIQMRLVAKVRHESGHVGYDMTPLTERLKPFASQRLAERRARRILLATERDGHKAGGTA
jgi:DNA-binding MarR family transcriptional regulator